MDPNIKTALITIDLIKAIQDNDLDLMKKTLKELEDLYLLHNSLGHIWDIPFIDLYNQYNNESFNYLLDNCSVPIVQLESIKARNYFDSIIKTKTNDEIKNFIDKQVQNKDNDFNLSEIFFLQLLLKLSMHINYYDKLRAIEEKILELEESF